MIGAMSVNCPYCKSHVYCHPQKTLGNRLIHLANIAVLTPVQFIIFLILPIQIAEPFQLPMLIICSRCGRELRGSRGKWKINFGKCPACRYNLRHSTANACPECGWTYTKEYLQHYRR